MILEGKVEVNGIVVDTLGFKVNENDEIKVEGFTLSKEEKVVYLLNKPRGVISSAKDDRGRTTVVDLIDSPLRLYPLGRLDYDSSGLILLSNDGELTQMLIHPSKKVDKVYLADIEGLITSAEISILEKGVKIDDYITSKAKIRLLKQNKNKKTSKLEVTIHEGKNRQIRKMFETLNYKVVKLHRIKEGNIELGDLKVGEYRKLKPHEVKNLKAYLKRSDV